MFGADRLAEPPDLLVAELDDPVALGAVHVVVGRVAEVVLVGRAIGEPKLTEQVRFDQEPEGPIDRRPADLSAGSPEVCHKLIGVEVLVRVEDVTHQDAPWLGELLAPDLEELAEFLLGAILDQDATKGLWMRHVRRPQTQAMARPHPHFRRGRATNQ